MSLRWSAVFVVIAILAFAVAAMMAAGGPRVGIDVTLSDYRIQVSRNWVRKGDVVKLTIRNAGKVTHELEVEGYDREVEEIRPGQVRTLTFRASRAGAFDLVCRLPGHYEQGMRAELKVVA